MFATTVPLLTSFFTMAKRYNARMSAQADYMETILKQASGEQDVNPREEGASA